MKTSLSVVFQAAFGLVVFAVLFFLPAGTFNYWQAWVLIAVFTISTLLPSLHLARKDPAALERRRHGGPTNETRTVQKIVISGAFVLLPAVFVFCALDHRFGWSPVPAVVSLIGDALVAIGLGIAMLVVFQNSYAAANITVEDSQRVVCTGLYGLVRHPMYAGTLIMMAGIPLALDSWYGLVFVIPGVVGIAARILDEEKMLKQELAGYREYAQKVHYRLVPYVW
ncbi:isoprenylcysteine carboxylmethyltransferase family protein [Mycobacterium sp.]|jgi:protein-S-isoprenylcysteine O-methyltransferase Ste14|uniref:methyltransferase family protein n=1 Tax=Mycobacterium sp. TaxID=1785 RepID=UPI002D7109AD|nr:isoprenylcysteine carboxylmethyltransferase family protein [Mycobacterium sp.]HZA11741.1 isoprenylcysteine carboxylmethyltransferase family protein [Mycobacterium sp.]